MKLSDTLSDSWGWLAPLVAALISAGVTLFGAWLAWPKQRAEAGLVEAQAENAVWDRWHREISRLEKIIREQGAEINGLRATLRDLAQGELTYIRAIAQRDGRIAELEGIIASASFPVAPHTAAALRVAHGVPRDEESARLEQRALEGLADEKGSDKGEQQ